MECLQLDLLLPRQLIRFEIVVGVMVRKWVPAAIFCRSSPRPQALRNADAGYLVGFLGAFLAMLVRLFTMMGWNLVRF